jgi:ferrochelatase
VRGGRAAPPELVEEFQRRFARVGGSPLTRITREQAAALERHLNQHTLPESGYLVRVGMRHAPPFIADGLRELVEGGAQCVIGVILSPQYSTLILGGYLRAFDAAREEIASQLPARVAGAWCDEPAFLDALAAGVRRTLDEWPFDQRDGLPLFFTAHSLPLSVAEREPEYLEQLRATARLAAERAGLQPDRWQFSYQSAGHTPEPWLQPDVKDLLPALRDAGHRAALVVPVQFLSDHLEVLYDIDVAAREEADALGIDLRRTPSLNTDPGLIKALAAVVQRELAELSPA